jgi:peptide/nickel transport system permease protein
VNTGTSLAVPSRPLAAAPRLALSNRRTRTLLAIILTCLLFVLIIVSGYAASTAGLKTALDQRYVAPSLDHPFGTDWLGRDMLVRTLKGLIISLQVGLLATVLSVVLGTTLGLTAGLFGKRVDTAITWIIDLCMGMPHLVAMILVAFMMGGGVRGVIVAVVITHWTGLARIIRAEVLQLRATEYVQMARKLGRSPWWIARRHLLPHVLPQFIVGLILLFPHAILHEAGLSFIGIGMSPDTPAVGIILAEAKSHLITGYWWLAVFPGLSLLLLVKLFDVLGENLRDLIDPKTGQE